MPDTELKILMSKFEDHCEANNREGIRATNEREIIKKELREIKDNHMEHLKGDVAELKTNMQWVIKIQWALVTGVVGNLIGVIYLIFNKYI